jgi:hypothetical protein
LDTSKEVYFFDVFTAYGEVSVLLRKDSINLRAKESCNKNIFETDETLKDVFKYFIIMMITDKYSIEFVKRSLDNLLLQWSICSATRLIIEEKEKVKLVSREKNT